ncbi:cysteine--tRNA ligase [Gilvimarinus agarilyticus]|uniref:cysteine--tRNA ligase n=1 Tax=unclassified Gilvimarinus TaxID=2642066 RepID=UPI001C088B26|nr:MULTISPECIES: cysteine--tRNA ligase [unclassified Gilvimarinus]MBU2887052.1 cysteine--tRNA ligase [Gilvimarinus agarilyticus]MDO6571712.1 cysteine--tRNA ligase [Gilvimarinus sp. 2_MG-2023]MDO6745784.1 cysteine--tRNA ligase [Gilvimarinus sp. 1_MG-2023]
MSLKIYSTLTRQKEIFTPNQAGKISLYVCGVTVYDFCHVGHARVLVAFDVITRFLKARGWEVDYVRNITDIDDKILQRADENGEDYTDLTARFIDFMHEDERALGILPPNKEPRATAHIDDIINMVKALIDKGHAYAAANGDVYYRVNSFADYGKLTNKNLEDLLAGARVEVGEVKEDPRDFALWKHAEPNAVGWESPWGKGRPGWHIECSAMSKHCLGANFDIHGGGPDLPFPHHENEIAQSEAANGCTYANYWMHAGAVRLDGEKMSKSLGNFFTIREVLKKYHPEIIRYVLLGSHYRSPINYSEDSLVEARSGLERFYSALRGHEAVPAASFDTLTDEYSARFVVAMEDDFNTSVALAAMFDAVRALNSATEEAVTKPLVAAIKSMGQVLGILQDSPEAFLQAGAADEMSAVEVEALIEERIKAKATKDYARADEIRGLLTDAGIVLEDSPQGTLWRRS